MKEVYVSEVMTENVTTCPLDTALKDVVKKLSGDRLSSLVITKDGEPVGIITERDMVGIMADMLNDVVWHNLTIDHFMSSPTYTIRADIALHEAVELSKNKTIRHLPVVNEKNKLIGLLTQTDMVNGLSRITYV